MSETVTPRVTTQYPANEVLVITAPLNTPVSAAELINGSSAIAGLQSQITALAARVTALENAAATHTGTTA